MQSALLDILQTYGCAAVATPALCLLFAAAARALGIPGPGGR